MPLTDRRNLKLLNTIITNHINNIKLLSNSNVLSSSWLSNLQRYNLNERFVKKFLKKKCIFGTLRHFETKSAYRWILIFFLNLEVAFCYKVILWIVGVIFRKFQVTNCWGWIANLLSIFIANTFKIWNFGSEILASPAE